MLGIGVMLNLLSGNEVSARAMQCAVGKRIKSIEMRPGKTEYDKQQTSLRIAFDDGTAIDLFDDGQSCCESRYMTCDDDLSAFVGADLRGAEVRDGGNSGDRYEGDVHETAFLVVETSLGAFTVCTHNEHNGYYGGFSLRCREVEA